MLSQVEIANVIVNSLGGRLEMGAPTDGSNSWGSDNDQDGIFSGMIGDVQVKTNTDTYYRRVCSYICPGQEGGFGLLPAVYQVREDLLHGLFSTIRFRRGLLSGQEA